jgi:hypothetical protein
MVRSAEIAAVLVRAVAAAPTSRYWHASAVTIYEWLASFPEFRRSYETAVLFRDQCWMDDCVDIADAHTARRA